MVCRLGCELGRLGLLATLIWLLVGCDAVHLTAPLGETPVDAAELQGLWLTLDSEPQVVHVYQTEPGRLQLAWVERRNDRFVLETNEALVRRDGEQDYFNLPDPDLPQPAYLFARYRRDPTGELLLWLPRVETFREEVEAGRLPGRVEADKYSTQVFLTAPAADIATFLRSRDPVQLWRLDKPLRLKRLAQPEP
jgi:hypothetical protein